MRNLAELFIVFAKIGCMSFGGGYAMLPLLERELTGARGWTTLEDIMRYYTISQITPGIIAVNVATFIGHKRGGVPGGIAATLGFVLPSATMVVLIASAISSFENFAPVRHALAGIRLAALALILDTVIKLIAKLVDRSRPALENVLSAALFALSFAASFLLGANPVFIVAAAGFCGFLFFGGRR